jgi:hypothetical protein
LALLPAHRHRWKAGCRVHRTVDTGASLPRARMLRPSFLVPPPAGCVPATDAARHRARTSELSRDDPYPRTSCAPACPRVRLTPSPTPITSRTATTGSTRRGKDLCSWRPCRGCLDTSGEGRRRSLAADRTEAPIANHEYTKDSPGQRLGVQTGRLTNLSATASDPGTSCTRKAPFTATLLPTSLTNLASPLKLIKVNACR